MRRRDKIARLFCAEGADPESIEPHDVRRNGFSDVQLHIKVRSPSAKLMLASILSHGSPPGMTKEEALARAQTHLTRLMSESALSG
jgi:hypothetical protein